MRRHYIDVLRGVVPYIGTWIETGRQARPEGRGQVVPYIGTWIETISEIEGGEKALCRTLYRYVD